MVKIKKKKLFLILLLVIAIFTKIDFRLKQELECCNDDHDYFIHAETTILDFDFDYSNQLEGFEKRRNYINLKFTNRFLWLWPIKFSVSINGTCN